MNEFVGVRSYRQNEGRMNRNLSRAENYLSLVGLVVLILGGIGVSSVTRVFVQQKVKSIAILKCVGSTSGQVLAIYLTQVVLLGLAGSALGVAHRVRRAAVAAGVRWQSCSLAAGGLRADGWCCRTRSRDRRARVAPLFSRPAARGAEREAVAAVAPGRAGTAALRLAEVDGRNRGGRGACRGRVVAGGLGAGRPAVVRRVRCVDVRTSSRRRRPHPSRSAASILALVRACARPCCTSRVPATRRGSFCWPLASARSSSLGSERSR